MLGKNIDENGAYWDNNGFGTTPWPACGEIDIMEHWGNNQNFVQSAMHTPSSFGGTINKGGQMIPTASSAYHVYELEWSPTKMVFSIDNRVHYTYNPPVKNASTWPFTTDQYLLLNIAIQPSILPSFTQSDMIVDYVRVYQLDVTRVAEIAGRQPLLVYPNPVNDAVTIELPSIPNQVVTVRLFNTQGQLLRDQKIASEQHLIVLNQLEALPTGLYHLLIETDSGRHFAKFSKK
jgi:hypothetical protein